MDKSKATARITLFRPDGSKHVRFASQYSVTNGVLWFERADTLGTFRTTLPFFIEQLDGPDDSTRVAEEV
jgi:hypothetical protein